MPDVRPKVPRPASKDAGDGLGSGTRRTSMPAAPPRARQATLLGIPGPSGLRPSRVPGPDLDEADIITELPPQPPPFAARKRFGAAPPAPSNTPAAEEPQKPAKQDLGRTAIMPQTSSRAFDRTLVLPQGNTPAPAPSAAPEEEEPTQIRPMPVHEVGESRLTPLAPGPFAAAAAQPRAPSKGLALKLPPIPGGKSLPEDGGFEDEAPTRPVDLASLAREKSGARRRTPSVPDATSEPAVLLVGFTEELCEALTEALGRHTIFVEAVDPGSVVPAVTVAAPDLVVLWGDGGRQETKTLLDELASSPLSSVVPVALVTDDPDLGARLAAFRHGAAAVIPRSASISTLAERINELVREIPERGDSLGRVGEATLGELVDTLAQELRSGILTVKQEGAERESVRLVLGRGRPLATLIDEFVTRVRSQIEHAEPLLYEFDERAMGTVEFLASDFDDEEPAADVGGLRLILADDDSARADAVAQELRAHGAQVVVTDLEPSAAHLGRMRQLDPMVLVIGDRQLQGSGYHLVKSMRDHRRLRWASLLVVHWEELWSEERGVPNTSVLLNRLVGLAEPERVIASRLKTGEVFDTRLEALGPARLLRALVSESALRVTIRNPRYYVQVSISQGLVAGAVGFTQAGARLEGPQALAAMLNLGSGRVHVEPGRANNATNLMTTVDVALGLAEVEEATIPESIPAPPPSDLPPALPRIATQPAGLAAALPELPVEALPSAQSQLSDGSVQAPGPNSLRPPRPSGLRREHKLLIGVGSAAVALLGLVLTLVLIFREEPTEAASLSTAQREQAAEPAQSPASPSAAAAPAEVAASKPVPLGAAAEEPTPKGEPAEAPAATQKVGAATTQPPAAAELAVAESKASEPKAEPEAPSTAAETTSGGLPTPERKAAPTCKEALANSDPPVGGKGGAMREVERAKRAIIAGDLARAQRGYCQALQLASDDSRAAGGLGLVLMMWGDGVQAVQYLEQALRIDGDDATRLLLGDALALAGRNTEAIEQWLKSAGVKPEDAARVESQAHVNQTKGDQAFRQVNYLRAERLYRRAVVLSPRRVEAGAQLARVLMGGERKAEALAWAKWVTTERPKTASFWVLLGDVQAAAGDKAAARDAFMKARELEPKNAEVAFRLR